MSPQRRLWTILGLMLLGSFSVLLWLGREIYRTMPPVPTAFATPAGQVVYTRADIETGRQVWQSIGGQQLGSIWGHGSYVAPDWTADWLHREALEWLDRDSLDRHAANYTALGADDQAAAVARLTPRIRANTYDATRDTVTVPTARAAAMKTVADHYISLFGDDPANVIPFRAQLDIYHRHRIRRILEEGELPGGAAPLARGYLEAAQAGKVYGGNAASFLTSF